MRVKSKSELRTALAKLINRAKCHMYLCDSELEKNRWLEVFTIADDVLDHPSIADLEDLLGGESLGVIQ